MSTYLWEGGDFSAGEERRVPEPFHALQGVVEEGEAEVALQAVVQTVLLTLPVSRGDVGGGVGGGGGGERARGQQKQKGGKEAAVP